MEENLQYSKLNLDFIVAGFVIRLEIQQKLWLCLITCWKLQEMKTIAKMVILNYKYLHKFVAVCV